MEQLVQEELPIGSSRQEVETFLERNNIEHSWIEDDLVFYSIRGLLKSRAVVLAA
jgi:hypothetical protein